MSPGGSSSAAADEWSRVLVLTRKPKQSIMIGDGIEVTVLAVAGEKVRVGIEAPSDVPVFRTEIYRVIEQGREKRAERTDVGPEAGDAPTGGSEPGRGR